MTIRASLTMAGLFLACACGSVAPLDADETGAEDGTDGDGSEDGRVTGGTEGGGDGGGGGAIGEGRAILRVGNYNIQWFGSTEDGPSDEALQLERAAEVMQACDADVWVLQEIVDSDQFAALLDRLPGYDGVLANDAAVASGSAFYSPWEQKVAIVFRTSVAQMSAPRLILTDHAYDFGSRPPLAVELTVAGTLHLTLIGLHMKAMSDSSSYWRRLRAGEALHQLLDGELAGAAVLVLGDWNDDIDASIAWGEPTPFAAIAGDGDFRFFTRELSLANVGSRVYGNMFIDHQLAAGSLRALYAEGTTTRFEAEALFPDYAATTSDHLPILSDLALGAAAGR